MNEANALRPRCGAKGRTTGEPCRNTLSKGRTRCRLHGGRVPKGEGWHRPLWPDRADPNAIEKMNRKLRDRERAARKRARRLAGMSPDERQRHEAWQRSHKPGPPGPRAAERARREADRAAREIFASPSPAPVIPEADAIRAEADALRARLAEFDGQAAPPWNCFD